MPILFVLGLVITSCGDDGESVDETLPRVLGNIPSAVDVKSTTAYVPVSEIPTNGNLELRVCCDGDPRASEKYWFYCYTLDGDGFSVKGLEPSRTYYYTIAFYKGGKGVNMVCSDQVKSFTTQGVSIEFIGQGESNRLRLKTTAVEDWDDVTGLHVHLYGINDDGEIKGVNYDTQYLGDGIWEANYFIPFEGDRWKAVIVGSENHIFAETPIHTFVNGKWQAE